MLPRQRTKNKCESVERGSLKWISNAAVVGKSLCLSVCMCVYIYISHFSFRLCCSPWALDPSVGSSVWLQTASYHFIESAVSVLLRLCLLFCNPYIFLSIAFQPFLGGVGLYYTDVVFLKSLTNIGLFPNRCCSSYPSHCQRTIIASTSLPGLLK